MSLILMVTEKKTKLLLKHYKSLMISMFMHEITNEMVRNQEMIT